MPSDAMRDVRWAWRNLRARGLRGVLPAVLIAVAIAANVLVFAVADSLVFRPLPYHEPDGLVVIQRSVPQRGAASPFLPPAVLDEWRQHQDLFAGVHGYLTKTIFLTGDGVPETVFASDITPGLVELLGASPRWGRSLRAADAQQVTPQPALISEALARTRFGGPAAAVGRTLTTTGEPLLVVGVMPRSFRFPQSTYEIWRALDTRGPLAEGFAGASALARLRAGLSVEAAAPVVEQRGAEVARAVGAPAATTFGLASWSPGPARTPEMFLALLGAALCLLLLVCANAASLELAGAVRRARAFAIQLSLGASRARLCRIVLIEGAMFIGFAAAIGAVVAYLGSHTVTAAMPETLLARNVNPIDLDGRALALMAGAAVASWLLVSLPLVVFVARGTLAHRLKVDADSASPSAVNARVRRMLTVAQVGAAVFLVVGAALYTRTYLALLDLEKGFDSSGVLSVQLTIPPQSLPSFAERRALVDRVRSIPGVASATEASSPTSNGERYRSNGIERPGAVMAEEELSIKVTRTDRDYFTTLRIPLEGGRWFRPDEPAASVIVSAPFAARYFPGGDAVGQQFRWGPQRDWLEIVGIVGHVRDSADDLGAGSSASYAVYAAQQPPPPPARPAATGPQPNGGFFGRMSLLVRVDRPERVGDVVRAVRAAEPRFALDAELVDDLYAEYFEARLLTARVVGGFGILAFVVAMAGVYAVMAFLVASRTREIGIRMALGAHAPAVRRFVLGSAVRMVALGGLLGMAAAVGASRWIEAQLFGVAPADPSIMTLTFLATLAVATLAAWQPAQRATRIDPVVALRSE